MKLSVPTNWDRNLLPLLESSKIQEVYGKLAEDFIGGGRVGYSLANISRRKITEYIRDVHKAGCEFNYLLNAFCLGGREFMRNGRKEIFKLLNWVVKNDVDSVTVSIPYLAEIIRKNFPQLKIKVSTIAQVDSIEKAKYWESLGVSAITLHYAKVNRNFRLLEKIREAVRCELQLIANNHCLYDCPIFMYHHGVFDSHGSQKGYNLGCFNIDYCYLTCRYLKLLDPMLLISSPWIRPEDIKWYEQIGINTIKLVDRTSSTEDLKRIITAYIQERYKGNLADLFPSLGSHSKTDMNNIYLRIKHFSRSFTPKRLLLLLKIKHLLRKVHIHIENSALVGFIEYFFTNDCQLISCADCGYCGEVAKKAVTVNADCQKMIQEHEEIFRKLF